MGGPEMAPIPPSVRSAPGYPGRSSVSLPDLRTDLRSAAGNPERSTIPYRIARPRFEAAAGFRAAGRDGGRTAIASTSTRSSGRTSPLTTSNVFGG